MLLLGPVLIRSYIDLKGLLSDVERLEHELTLTKARCEAKPKALEMKFRTANATFELKCSDAGDKESCRLDGIEATGAGSR